MTTTTTKAPTAMNRMERLAYRGPEFDQDGVLVQRFTVGGENESFGAFLANLQYAAHGRPCNPGEYAKLIVDDTLWMSDTTAERHDHLLAVAAADLYGTNLVNTTGLVNGLGTLTWSNRTSASSTPSVRGSCRSTAIASPSTRVTPTPSSGPRARSGTSSGTTSGRASAPTTSPR